ncbi:MAG: tRNA 2-selenouridine(34) synthase MnmH [Bacteroidota bacterium]|nr:tRNA 2-selenouridine(34) synthase MnmH [Bacteroidota bacterium]
MPLVVKVEEFLKKAESLPVLDTRSPSEYAKGHIPGAISFPLFDDQERAEVGTLYTKKGREQAVLRGLEIVGPKMKDFVLNAKKHGNSLLLYCWRGGMRSNSMAWLLKTAGLRVWVLEGGYKEYRNYFREAITPTLKLIMLGGPTGCGKTEILYELKQFGEQVLDLEALACHKGSSFGALGQPAQPTTEHFGNLIYHTLWHLDLSRPIWIEGESQGIGHVFIPIEFFEKMCKCDMIHLTLDKLLRINRLVNEYASFPKEDLANGLNRISRRLGGQNAMLAIDALDQSDYAKVAEIALSYYDKAYELSLAQRSSDSVKFIAQQDNPKQTALDLMHLAHRKFYKLYQ